MKHRSVVQAEFLLELETRQAQRDWVAAGLEEPDPRLHRCAACGKLSGCFGFGVFRHSDAGAWACDAPQCRATVEALISGS